jgi:hypothetical protein
MEHGFGYEIFKASLEGRIKKYKALYPASQNLWFALKGESDQERSHPLRFACSSSFLSTQVSIIVMSLIF